MNPCRACTLPRPRLTTSPGKKAGALRFCICCHTLDLSFHLLGFIRRFPSLTKLFLQAFLVHWVHGVIRQTWKRHRGTERTRIWGKGIREWGTKEMFVWQHVCGFSFEQGERVLARGRELLTQTASLPLSFSLSLKIHSLLCLNCRQNINRTFCLILNLWPTSCVSLSDQFGEL